MAANEPIDLRVRLAISPWPDDAPRGAVSTFCAEHAISRTSFYELRKRAEGEGPAAVLEPQLRRLASSPPRLTVEARPKLCRTARLWKPPAADLRRLIITEYNQVAAAAEHPTPQDPRLADSRPALNQRLVAPAG